ncbi:MAG TPA: tripartite tricarboxylate transporter substrate binding protein [Xanthobacteraceae bacterium]|nr:tripartite tricarboxylate transporter substrate binding protein [Xanthobacteraceae bacterium]
MTLCRRGVLQLAAGAAMLPAGSRVAWAQAYPGRPVRVVVGLPAGLGPDIVARLLAQSLSARLGQPFVVENKPGAGSNLGAEAVIRSPPDGYSLFLITTANAVNATLYRTLDFNIVRDVAPVASIGGGPAVMVVTPSFPAKTVPEFLAYAKANPGRINMASAGVGSVPHVFGELFMMMAHVDMLHVPYRGNFYPDLLGGQVQVAFGNIVSSLEYIRASKLRALAVTTAKRAAALPDVPALAEFVPGYEASAWYGLAAPKDTPPEVIATLNTAVNAALTDPQLEARLADLGAEPRPMSPAQFREVIVKETGKWAAVVQFAGANLD